MYKFFLTKEWTEYEAVSSFGDKPFFIYNDDLIYKITDNLLEVRVQEDYFKKSKRDKLFEEMIFTANQYDINYIKINNHALFKDYRFLPVINYYQSINLSRIYHYSDKIPKKTESEIKRKKEKLYDIRLCSLTNHNDYGYISSIVDRFKFTYFDVVGRKTRPEETFRMIENWIYNGSAILFYALKDKEDIGYTLIHIDYQQAYYFMSAIYDEYKNIGLGYLMQYEIVKYLKFNGIKEYIIGDQPYNNLHCQPDEKNMNIAAFKRKFGGELKADISGELFLDKEYMKKVFEERINAYGNNCRHLS